MLMKKSLKERLAILSDAAKHDASCASSGTMKRDLSATGGLDSTEGSGICLRARQGTAPLAEGAAGHGALDQALGGVSGEND